MGARCRAFACLEFGAEAEQGLNGGKLGTGEAQAGPDLFCLTPEGEVNLTGGAGTCLNSHEPGCCSALEDSESGKEGMGSGQGR